MSHPQPITINILATVDTSPSTLFGLYDVLSSVGVAWENFITGSPGKPKFDVRIVAAKREPFHCAHDVLVSPHYSVEENEDADISIIASFVVPSLAPLKNKNACELEWLDRQRERGSTIASACTGAIMLAESGMLNGWEATTHWAFRELFRVYYPEVILRLEQDLCVTGENKQIVTSGGATSWQELALYLVTKFAGVEHASNAAKFWRIPLHDDGQAPFSAMTRKIPHEDGIVNASQDWIAENYANPSPIQDMVRESGLPATTFSRRFRRATGYRPIDYVHALRIEQAKSMLEVTQEAVESIGLGVGYEDPSSFRRIFKRKVGLTPSMYRRKFGRSRFERYSLPQQ